MASLIKLIGKHGKGKFAIIDDDMVHLQEYVWRLTPAGYVYRAVYDKRRQNNTSVYLHRQIMDNPKDLTVDHLNGNPLDNRKANLKTMTMQENLLNRHCQKCGRLPQGIMRAYSVIISGEVKYFNTINEAMIAGEVTA